ncbi:hypothetical protein IC620_01535 [Hazenella sp. IB182357]|uniref:Uncharacterized protein n=1 Tax=Polycladospora coralii TaxID=2771432 RepID=A0A926RW27_9BACL|nr:hypothetical protein [Polycladospora coralii]MBD1371041.1 hypothetical protein [Polycladospora coralii]
MLKKYGAGDQCYVISFNDEIDGRYLKLEEAIEKAVGSGFPSLISCIPDKLAYVEGEQIDGPPERYIIYKQ